MTMKGVSFVLPCLNEERNLRLVIDRINSIRTSALQDRETEIIVSDNGSTDRSVEIAIAAGAKVVQCQEKGYGANLKNGIRHAQYPIVIFADADNTYDLAESPALIQKLEEATSGLVMGSRFKGTIHQGAMPFLHRYLGTPALTFLINLFHRRNQVNITDCNSGFRCFYKKEFDTWGIASDGMDFASEMLLKAFKSGATVEEVPITLSRNDKDRIPHLKTWQDGMKHLLRFFVESPDFFFFAGVTLFIVGISILIPSYIVDIIQLGPMRILGAHTTMIANLVAGTGIQLWCFGAFIALKDYKEKLPVKLTYRWIIEIREDKLFWFVFLYFLSIFTVLGYIFIIWESHLFKFLNIEDNLLIIIFSITGLSTLVVNILAIHILKRI
jgi:glycosyltransferase involved in cell wall biosynthesis